MWQPYHLLLVHGSLQLIFPFCLQNSNILTFQKKTTLFWNKGGSTLVSDNHTVGNFRFNRAFLGKGQWLVRWISNQILDFRMGTHLNIEFIAFLCTGFSTRKVYHQSLVRVIENTAFSWYLKGELSPVCHPLTTPLLGIIFQSEGSF